MLGVCLKFSLKIWLGMVGNKRYACIGKGEKKERKEEKYVINFCGHKIL